MKSYVHVFIYFPTFELQCEILIQSESETHLAYED
jgi:hypothetical protein